MKDTQTICARVAELYAWVDRAVKELDHISEPCQACGQCCDFKAYDHRLFLTSPEFIFFQAHLTDPVKAMTTGRCPYQVQGKCSVYDIRFLGCRIFGCTRPDGWQDELMETALQRFKALCDELDIPYQYVDLATALKLASPAVASGEGQVASKAKPEPKSSSKTDSPTTE
jgi:Fe-S-cluster containining protein